MGGGESLSRRCGEGEKQIYQDQIDGFYLKQKACVYCSPERLQSSERLSQPFINVCVQLEEEAGPLAAENSGV